MSSLNRDGLQFDDLDANYESEEDYEYVRSTESDEADSDRSESEPEGSGSGSESESESDWSEHHAFLFDPFLDEWSIKNEEELEKYYDVVFNLEKTRGRFFNCLEDLKTGGVFYRSVKNRVNTAVIHYNKKNQTGFRAGKILNCVLNAAGGAKLYLTFVAKDFNTGDVREFQACVYESAAGGDRRVNLCRLKIPKEPCEGDGKCI
ncbi:uncharacterized protein [Coffea arabica]|uniref:Uncharacterized protein isoform X2 n=1 Tax=Coffea arabica TaxID=13443 RepID=A0A6P6SGP3_COFAR|nr:uncharacterized protein LOC113690799 [Coffea arabica]